MLLRTHSLCCRLGFLHLSRGGVQALLCPCRGPASALVRRHLGCTAAPRASATSQAVHTQAPEWHGPTAAAAEVTEWAGLRLWRGAPLDRRRQWGRLHCEEGAAARAAAAAAIELPSTLAECACLVLRTSDPLLKAALSHRIWEAHNSEPLPLGSASPPDVPSRPELPELVPPRQIPTQKASPLPLNVYQLHNLAHVELNAIDLAWDTIARFAHVGLPLAFYEDFAHVADDESRHFGWCSQRLNELDQSYGDMPAHSILWQGAQASAGDIGARLAVVPLGAEARGLDAAPRLVQRLRSFNDHPTAAIVDLIGLQEKAHVAVGVFWFNRMTAALGQEAAASYRGWLSALCPDLLQGKMNHEARSEVGLQRTWYDAEMWPQGEGVLQVPPTDLDALRTRLVDVLDDCGTAATCLS